MLELLFGYGYLGMGVCLHWVPSTLLCTNAAVVWACEYACVKYLCALMLELLFGHESAPAGGAGCIDVELLFRNVSVPA